jgi:hypothetical protein
MQEFFINRGSRLPVLEMSLIENGRYGSEHHAAFYVALQNATIYFNMVDIITGVPRIAHQRATIVENEDCPGTYNLQYQWRKRDTERVGKYRGQFEIVFGDDNDSEFSEQNLVVPIYDELIININDGLIKKC